MQDITFYCGLSNPDWHGYETRVNGFACVSPIYGKRRTLTCINLPNLDTQIILDSGAFTDLSSGLGRMSYEAALARQIRHASVNNYPIRYIATYDCIAFKLDPSTAQIDDAIKRTIKASQFIQSSEAQVQINKGVRIVHTVQGYTANDYLRCFAGISPFLDIGDMVGFGGFSILGKKRTLFPLFKDVAVALVPCIAQSGITALHLWGCMYAPALAYLLKLCDAYGVTLSTDSSGAVTRPCFGEWGYADWRDPQYKKPANDKLGLDQQRHVSLTFDWLKNFRSTSYYLNTTL